MKKIANLLISPPTLFFILLAGIVSMAVATFIENDFGSQTARAVVYNSLWFELLFVMFAINLTGNIIKRKLYKKEKLSIFLFHIAFIVMIIGAGVTRYYGVEGVMHIREGKTSSELVIQEQNADATVRHRTLKLPFAVRLDSFVVQRYPGSMSPSSFSSYVTVVEKGKQPQKFHIYMNNVLKAHGYRFYQSSYDSDEKGTILSVNYDSTGTFITYVGYLLLLAGVILSLLNRNSFLWKTTVSKEFATVVILLSLSATVLAQTVPENNVSKQHAEKFGRLFIQDNTGRTEPVYTFSSDILRKLSRKTQFEGLSPVQVFIGMNLFPEKWEPVPIIRVTNPKLRNLLHINGKYASYTDFVKNGNYVLHSMVEVAYNTPPAKQNKFYKALIKADEKVNICYMIFSGQYLKMFPDSRGESHNWRTYKQIVSQGVITPKDSIIIKYFDSLRKAVVSTDYSQADINLDLLSEYQINATSYQLPSGMETTIEVMYYKWDIFYKLFFFYTITGVLFLLVLIVGIISGKSVPVWLLRVFFYLILVGFIAHVLGFSARWYISGHAPMSNGYESLVFISMITMFAGLIFSRQSKLALSATSVLAGLSLMVAHLSFMDPQITNLVPVLKSYWLTIHVSVITGSYGFLGLGALMGIINMILILSQSKGNKTRIADAIIELTKINHRTLILGLYFLTIGTFLGAVWANESWGRYWGWDPKETWSLISMLVYTLVIHSRMIPGMRGVFAFNALSIIAFGSVLMTYFGVNYYLSGLHSYAAGDPVPIPVYVYVIVTIIILLIISAFVKKTSSWK